MVTFEPFLNFIVLPFESFSIVLFELDADLCNTTGLSIVPVGSFKTDFNT